MRKGGGEEGRSEKRKREGGKEEGKGGGLRSCYYFFYRENFKFYCLPGLFLGGEIKELLYLNDQSIDHKLFVHDDKGR